MKKINWMEITAVTMISATFLLIGLDMYFKPHTPDPNLHWIRDVTTRIDRLCRHYMEEIDRLHREGCQ